MPNTGGICRKLWKQTAVTMVSKNKPTIVIPPYFNPSCSPSTSAGLPDGKANCIINAGIRKLTTEGINRAKNSPNCTIPFCHTIKVVISPKGLKAPPALAPTTILIQEIETKAGCPLPTARTTAHIINAVVRLSAMGEMKKAKIPVSQNRLR